MFQPIELGSKPITRFDRVQPVDYKREKIIFKLPDNIPSYVNVEEEGKVIEEDNQIMIVMETIFQELQNPGFISSMDKENWVKAAAWSILNLNRYNNIEMNILAYSLR